MTMLWMENQNMILKTKISALPPSKINTFEHLSDVEILPCNHQKVIEQDKFTYSQLGKAFGKQIETIEDRGNKAKQFKIKDLSKQSTKVFIMIKIAR